MDRFTCKKPNGTYQIDDYKAVHAITCFDENFEDVFNIYKGKAIDKLAYYEDLEEEGRLVILPCKVGDSFFTYSWGCHGSHDDCWEQDDCDECPHLLQEIREYKFKNVVHILNAEKDFGKTIFSTREEAEAVMND